MNKDYSPVRMGIFNTYIKLPEGNDDKMVNKIVFYWGSNKNRMGIYSYIIYVYMLVVLNQNVVLLTKNRVAFLSLNIGFSG